MRISFKRNGFIALASMLSFAVYAGDNLPLATAASGTNGSIQVSEHGVDTSNEIQQARVIQGTVLEEGTNEPLIGVNVVVKGTTIGTTTDVEGKYSIRIPSDNAVLVFSYIGQKTEEYSVKGLKSLDVIMKSDATMLSEVVVYTGYMTQKKADLTGSVALADSKDIKKTSANVMKAMQGKMAGVKISNNGGNPAEDIGIQIRGLSSLSGAVFAQSNMTNEMFDLAKLKSGVKNKRISSTDPTGGNRDHLEPFKPGEKRIIADIKGAGAINHIWVTIAPPPPALSRNDIIIRMYWDGNDYPSVESPIGPFFGQGWDERYNYASLPLSSGPENGTGMSCYFTMPFEKGARIEIENQSDRNIDAFYFYVDYLEMDKLPKDMGRFHAWYNHNLTEALPEGETEWGLTGEQKPNTTGKDNYVFVETQGKGHFVGINYYVHCPTTMWYGEGDDMWFIDGEKTPSLIGTGTEDFFNTSWCPKEAFSHPYFGYPRVNNDIGWLGRTHVYRFFIADPIFFEKSVKGTIEHGSNNNLTLDLATVAYWYQDSAVALPEAPTKAQRAPKPFINHMDIHRWRDAWRKSKGNKATLWGNE
jgi:hypothetical protein